MTIYEALAGTGLPCSHPPYTGTGDAWITCELLGQFGTIYAEGREAETAVTYVVNLYCRGQYALTLRRVKAALEAAGWVVTVDNEFYEEQLRARRVVLTAEIEGAIYG